MSINASGWRPERPESGSATAPTFTGNKALMLEEPLIFEIGSTETTGVEVAPPAKVASRLSGLARNKPIGLPGLSEPEAVRHYTRLSRQNYAIDLGLFPLGSCTMKHNPRLNEKMARRQRKGCNLNGIEPERLAPRGTAAGHIRRPNLHRQQGADAGRGPDLRDWRHDHHRR